jgi:hypothetical protein
MHWIVIHAYPGGHGHYYRFIGERGSDRVYRRMFQLYTRDTNELYIDMHKHMNWHYRSVLFIPLLFRKRKGMLSWMAHTTPRLK